MDLYSFYTAAGNAKQCIMLNAQCIMRSAPSVMATDDAPKKLRRLRWFPPLSRAVAKRSSTQTLWVQRSICLAAGAAPRYVLVRALARDYRAEARQGICTPPIDKYLILIYNKSVETVGRWPRRAHLRGIYISATGREPKKRPRFCRPTQKNSFFSKNSVTFRNFCRLIG